MNSAELPDDILGHILLMTLYYNFRNISSVSLYINRFVITHTNNIKKKIWIIRKRGTNNIFSTNIMTKCTDLMQKLQEYNMLSISDITSISSIITLHPGHSYEEGIVYKKCDLCEKRIKLSQKVVETLSKHVFSTIEGKYVMRICCSLQCLEDVRLLCG